MKIHTYDVGPGHPVFIVAEGGSNHGGSLRSALALTDAAAEAGANAMKWQLWLSPDEMYDFAQFPREYEMTEKYTLPLEWLPNLRDRAHEKGMAFGLSSFGFPSLEEADKWVDFHKVASIEAGWKDFIKRVSSKGKPTFVSTGGMDWLETQKIHTAMRQIRAKYANAMRAEMMLLQCTLAYPAPPEEQDLLALSQGRHKSLTAWGFRIGFSDHTIHPTIAPCAAVALGACVIEKHLRPYIRTDTPDAPHSLNPYQFAKMVRAIRQTEQALGSSEKRIRPSEEPFLKYRRGPRGLRGS